MLFFPFGKNLLHLIELLLGNDALMGILNIKLAYLSTILLSVKRQSV